jgi:hypothetical protein
LGTQPLKEKSALIGLMSGVNVVYCQRFYGADIRRKHQE